MKLTKRILVLLMAVLIALPMTAMLGAVEASALSSTGGMHMVVTSATVTLYPGTSATGKEQTMKITISSGKITAPDCPFKANDSRFAFKGWSYGTSTYAAGTSIPLDSEDQSDGTVNLTAIFEAKSTESFGSSVSSGGSIYGTFNSGISGIRSVQIRYKSGEEFELPANPFTAPAGYTFRGWIVNGSTVAAGSRFTCDSDFSIYADWDVNDRIVISGGTSTSSSASSTTSSVASSSTSSKPASSSTASKPSSSSTASKPSSSSSAASISSSESSSASSVPEVSQPEVFTPVNLTYSVSGNMPLTKVNLLVKEDIGGTPQLWVTSIDSYNSTDIVTGRFIADGDALAALDLSVLLDGNAYSGAVNGTVTYTLNGTQATAQSSYGEHVLAMVHVTPLAKFSGTYYYMAEGKKAMLYNTESGTKSEVSNISFDEKDGVWRPAVGDVNSLSSFAYLASNDTIVEVKLIPDANAAEATIDVTSLSPILLVNLEIGKASAAAAGGLPLWVWIVIGVVAVIVIALVIFYFINRSNENKRLAARQERLENYSEKKAPRKAQSSSSVTGFDD